MLEILTAEEMRAAEQAAISDGVESFRLMQTAGGAVAAEVATHFDAVPVLVLCGPGNNGGDGFIVAQRLKEQGWDVRVMCLVPHNQLKGDAARAAEQWDGEIELWNTEAALESFGLVVDAVFGTGLARALSQEIVQLFDRITKVSIPVVAVDVPSGVYSNNGGVSGGTMKVYMTVTFCRKKLCHVLYPAREYCGRVVTALIEVTDDQVASLETKCFENRPALWLKVFPVPDNESHKYKRGHTLVFGGAKRTGAACLAASAAQVIGSGLVTMTSPKKPLQVYQSYQASLMVDECNNVSDFKELLKDKRKNSVVIGPGGGDDIKKYVKAAISSKRKVVLDADAFGAMKFMLKKLSPNCVLTPHEGEFAKLFPKLKRGSRLERARNAAAMTNAIIVLKGADTVIVAPDGTAVINTNAPPSLATAGAGDVLAGMIGGLMAQGMHPFMASCAAVWLHGETARRFGFGLIAEDLVADIPETLNTLFGVR